MTRLVKHAALLAILLSLGTVVSYSAGAKSEKAPSAPESGFRAEILANLSDVEKKIEDLADAVPADKYSWRPGEGVRSVSQVYVHIIGSNYLFMRFLGAKPPMKLSPSVEDSITEKAQIIPMLKPSFEHLRTTVVNLPDKDLDKHTEMFGSTVTYRAVLIAALTHLHEHLGQSIAYARMNNIVPPWTAARQAQQAK